MRLFRMKTLMGIGALIISLNGLSQFPRTVLLEVSESVYRTESEWSICAKEGLQASFSKDQLVVISHHWDDLRIDSIDPFFRDYSEQWAHSFGFENWKSAALDRMPTSDTSLALGAGFWDDTIYQRLTREVDVKVALPEVLYDPNYNEIYLRINTEFGADKSNLGDIRIHCYLMANGLVHNQLVNDEKNGVCNAFKDPLDTFKVKVITGDTYYITGKKDFKHNNVPIQTPTGFEGEKELFPSDVKAGNQFNLVKRFSKPAGYNLNDLYVVAFLASHADSSVIGNEVWNATEAVEFLAYDQDNPNDPNHPDNPDNPNSIYNPANWPSGIEFNRDKFWNVYPNPIQDLGIIDWKGQLAANTMLIIRDLNGIPIMEKSLMKCRMHEGKYFFHTDDLASGIYILELHSSDSIHEKLIAIVR